MKTLSSLSTTVLVVLLAACGQQNLTEDLKSTAPGGISYGAKLGSGFDRGRVRFSGANCVVGNTKLLGGKSSGFKDKNDMTFAEIQHAVHGYVGLSIPVYPGINATGEFEFSSNYGSSAFNQTLIVDYTYQGESLVLDDVVTNQETLRSNSRTQTNVAEDAMPIGGTGLCGDEFVQQIDRGGMFLGIMKIDFQNSYERSKWGGKVGVSLLGGLATAKLGVSKLSDRIKKNTLITVTAIQKGGRPEELTQLFPDGQAIILPGGLADTADDGSIEKSKAVDETIPYQDGIGIMSCSLENMEPCYEVHKRMLLYVKDNLPTQFARDEDLSPINYITTPYHPTTKADFKIHGQLNDNDLRAIEKTRAELHRKFASALLDMNRLRTIKNIFYRDLSEEKRQLLAKTETNLVANIGAVRKAITWCWEDLELCLDIDPENLEGFRAIDPLAFEVNPMRFKEWCELNNSGFLDLDESHTVEMLKVVTGESDCQLADDKLSKMEKITLARKSITNVAPLVSLPQLKYLDLRENSLADVSILAQLRNLVLLDLSGNRVSNLRQFTKGIWSIRTLLLENNFVTDLKPITDPAWGVEKLSVAGNRIYGSIPDLGKIPLLQSISLSNNKLLTNIDGLQNAVNLRTVELKGEGMPQLACPANTTCLR